MSRVYKPRVGVPLAGIGCYVITRKGDWLRETDPYLATEIGFSDPKLDAIGFAVRNMGFIQVAFVESGRLSIAFHPRSVEAPAVNSLIAGIDTMMVKQIDLCFLSVDQWLSEPFTSAIQARHRIRTLCSIEPESARESASKSVAKPIHGRGTQRNRSFSATRRL
jgi:hypothetical protein